MKKFISTLLAASAALCIGVHCASASLLGMPLNLKSALETIDASAPAASCQFQTDDVFAGPVLVNNC